VEITMVAAFYAMVSRIIDAIRVEIDPEKQNYSPKLP
jgi:hypothetical protein